MQNSSLSSATDPTAFLTRRAVVSMIILGVLGAASGYVGAMLVPTSPSATSTILVNPLEGNAYRPSGTGEDLINLTTEAQVVASDAMAKTVADELSWQAEPTALVKHLSVAVETNTQILSITFTDPDPKHAMEGAETYAESYLTFRKERASSSIGDERDLINAQVANLQSELNTLASQQAKTDPASSEATVLSARIQTLTSQLNQYNNQLADLSATTLNPGQLVAYATLDPANPLTGAAPLSALGALLGVLAAAAASYLLSRRSKTIRSAADVRLGRQVTVTTLEVGPDALLWGQEIPEPIVHLRGAALSALAAQARRVVLIATAGRADPVGSIALARSMARAGLRTVLVDVTGRISQPTELPDGATTFERLLGAHGNLEPLLAEGVDGVRLLPAGPGLEPTALALRGEAIDGALRSLLSRFDVVLLHTDALDSDLGRTLAAAAQHAIVEVRAGASRTPDLRAAAEACESTGAVLVGVVIVVPPKATANSPEVWLSELDETADVPWTHQIGLRAEGPDSAAGARVDPGAAGEAAPPGGDSNLFGRRGQAQ